MWRPKLMSVPSLEEALPGRDEPIQVEPTHFVSGSIITGDCPNDQNEVLLGLGCFWGAERAFWSLPGVVSTSVGYGGGHTKNPTYKEVCSGMTAHTELVRVRFKPDIISLRDILKVFWEKHDPTQGMRQGNDVGTQYRSVIYYHDEQQRKTAAEVLEEMQAYYDEPIVTELSPAVAFYAATEDHQNYYNKQPNQGYCSYVITPKLQKLRRLHSEKLRTTKA